MRKRAKRILLCASGGFQSFMLPGFIISLLRHVADDVQVVLSRAAAKLVSVTAVEAASRHKAFVEMDDSDGEVFVPHIELGRDIDFVLVYPATVNIVGKIANGIADELIAATVLATEAPVIIVPIANEVMWQQPAVVRNLEQLAADGYVVLPPLPSWEVATREGIEHDGPFPIPTLLVRMSALLDSKSEGRARR